MRLARGQIFVAKPSNRSYVWNRHRQVFWGTKKFLHSANLQAAISMAGFLQVPPKSSFKKLLLGTGLWHHTKMSTSLKSPDGLKDAECKKGQLSSRSSFLTRPPSACPTTPMGTMRNTSRAHCCSPPSDQTEGAVQEVLSSCQGCCKAVQGIEESPGSCGISRQPLDNRRCYGPQGGD